MQLIVKHLKYHIFKSGYNRIAYIVCGLSATKGMWKSREKKIEDNYLFIFCYHQLRSTDTDTATEIQHGGTLGHDKFQKTRIRLR